MPIPPLPSPSRRGSILTSAPFWIGSGITLFFAVMVFSLWRRESGAHYAVRDLGLSSDLITATWEDYFQNMWIVRGDERIGVYTLEVRRDELTGEYNLIARTRMALTLPGFADPITTSLDLDVMMSDQFEMESFQAKGQIAGERVSVDAFVEGLTLYYQFTAPPPLTTGKPVTASIELDTPVMLLDAILPVITRADQLTVGNTWSTRASNPISGNFGAIQSLLGGLDEVVTIEVEAEEIIELDGESVEAIRVSQTTGEMRTVSWYDLEANLLKTDLGNSMVRLRGNPSEINEFAPSLSRPEVFEAIDRTAIRDLAAAAKKAK